MQVRYVGPDSGGVVSADGAVVFAPGEAVEVSDEFGALLVASGHFEAVKPAAKTKTQEVQA